MPIRQYHTVGPYGLWKTGYYNQWENSGRDSKGQLILRDNLHSYYNSVLTAAGSTTASNYCQGASDPVTYTPTTDDINGLYAQLQGKLRNGNASLGMTLASMNQSMAMIVSRYEDINRLMGSALRRSKKRKVQPKRKELASSVLEVEFGWRTFIDDITNAFKVLTSEPGSLIRVGVTRRVNPYDSFVLEGIPRRTESRSGKAKLRAVGTYSVTNPNLWLANRLGLINPFQVAWDKVPWSWVVNMFVNVNQMVGSITDTVGLTNLSGSLTISSRMLREQTADWYPYFWLGKSYANTMTTFRDRQGLSNLRPSFSLRLPNFNGELAVIASALAVQRSRALGGY